MTSYPGAIASFPTLTDNVDYPQAAHINNLQNEVVAIETALGTNFSVPTYYKITPTVASNNLTLTITHMDGTTPSVSRPLNFIINSTVRACTAALAVTKNAATNWANLGSAELATKEADLFVYIVWNTNLGAVDVLWSRIPYANVYSEFSATTTNEKYGAINATAPAATDNVVNIGRFAATLSAGAGYTWSVPTFTTVNLVQKPCFETRVLTYAPAITGYSAVPTAANCVYQYYIVNRTVKIQLSEDATGTSNATTKTYSVPFTAKTLTNKYWGFNILAPMNNGAFEANGYGVIPSAGTVLTMNRSAGAAWTNSGNCIAAYRCNAEYETA
jgi:hypothetical protein